ncbi:hypothetical protein H1C71_031894 [Ictidomys tridecemlineatus]|nr:hypothetical protein H1C71_031894 [Ictidomys tridecemlineatus]
MTAVLFPNVKGLRVGSVRRRFEGHLLWLLRRQVHEPLGSRVSAVPPRHQPQPRECRKVLGIKLHKFEKCLPENPPKIVAVHQGAVVAQKFIKKLITWAFA